MVELLEHDDDTGFTTVVIADILCCPSLDHLNFGLGVGVPYGNGILQLGSN